MKTFLKPFFFHSSLKKIIKKKFESHLKLYWKMEDDSNLFYRQNQENTLITQNNNMEEGNDNNQIEQNNSSETNEENKNEQISTINEDEKISPQIESQPQDNLLIGDLFNTNSDIQMTTNQEPNNFLINHAFQQNETINPFQSQQSDPQNKMEENKNDNLFTFPFSSSENGTSINNNVFPFPQIDNSFQTNDRHEISEGQDDRSNNNEEKINEERLEENNVEELKLYEGDDNLTQRNSSENNEFPFMQQKREYKASLDVDHFKKLALILSHVSSKQEQALIMKNLSEKTIQGLYNSLWIKQENKNSYSSECACNETVLYVHKSDLIFVDENIYNKLYSEFKSINQHNIRNVFLSLYEQTNAEILLERFIFSNINKLKEDYILMMELLDVLIDLISSHNKSNAKLVLSKNSEKEVKELTLSLGYLLLSQVSLEEKKHQNKVSKLMSLEFNIDVDYIRNQFSEEGSSEASMEKKIDLIHSYLLKKLMHTGAISWAKCLLQPNMQQLLRNHWISKSLTAGNEKFYPEHVYVEALQQLPWGEIQKMKLDEARKFVLLPLQQSFKRFSSTGYNKLILTIGKLVIVNSFYFIVSTFCFM